MSPFKLDYSNRISNHQQSKKLQIKVVSLNNILGNMRNKTDLYAKEQDALIEEILRILELDEHRSWVLYDVENDPDKQNRLMGLIPSIRKFFSFSTIRGVSEPHRSPRPWLSMIRQITKSKYHMLSCPYQMKVEDNGETKKIRTRKYIFQKISI